MPKMEIEIGADGQVKVHVVGVSGPSCVPLTRALEQSLGTVTDVTKTSEYYKTATAITKKTTVTQ